MARFTYVISDIHGQFDALMEMLEQIEFSEEDELYILGDVIDRGPKSIECIQWIMSKDNVLTLLGNHEVILYDTYIHDAKAVYPSLDEIREKLSQEQQEDIMRWIMDMPECKLITVNGRKFYLNHTQAVSPDYFEEEVTNRMFPDYSKYMDYYNLTIEDIICIHGHIQAMQMRKWNGQEKDGSIWKNKSETIIDIDCGAGYPKEGGKLGCLRLNDMREFYVEI